MPCCSWYSDFGYFWVKKSYLDVGSSRYSHISSYLSIHSLFMFSCCSWGVDLANIAVLAGSPVELLMGRHRCQGPKLCHGLGRCSSYKERDNLTEICGKTLYMWWKKWLVSYRFPLKQIHWSIECSGVNHEPPSCAPRNTWSCLLAWQMGARPRRPRTGFPDVIVILIWWLLFCGLHVVSSIRKILNWHIPVDPFLFSMSTLQDHPVRKEPSDAEEREVEETPTAPAECRNGASFAPIQKF